MWLMFGMIQEGLELSRPCSVDRSMNGRLGKSRFFVFD